MGTENKWLVRIGQLNMAISLSFVTLQDPLQYRQLAGAWYWCLLLHVQYNISSVTEPSRDAVDNGKRLSNTSIRVHKLKTSRHGATLFPKLNECAHFHYEFVELQQIEVCLFNDRYKLWIVVIFVISIYASFPKDVLQKYADVIIIWGHS